jgi:hypothetical protein
MSVIYRPSGGPASTSLPDCGGLRRQTLLGPCCTVLCRVDCDGAPAAITAGEGLRDGIKRGAPHVSWPLDPCGDHWRVCTRACSESDVAVVAKTPAIAPPRACIRCRKAFGPAPTLGSALDRLPQASGRVG